MAYKPTGRPVGRPKTKDYTTISLKIPTTLLERVKTYAGLHRQSMSELIRDGLEWRIGEGDPRGLGVSTPHLTGSDAIEYYRNTENPSEMQEAVVPASVFQEILTTLARQEAQLRALAQAVEQRPLASVPHGYSGNTTKGSTGRQSSPEAVGEDNSRPAPQGVGNGNSNTVLQ